MEERKIERDMEREQRGEIRKERGKEMEMLKIMKFLAFTIHRKNSETRRWKPQNEKNSIIIRERLVEKRQDHFREKIFRHQNRR